MDWITCTKTFVTVVEQGTLAKAASQLNTTSSALSKRLSWLEQQLDVQLLKRTTRSLTLTDAGELFFHKSQGLLHDWQQLVDETTSTYGEVSGVFRIGAPLTIGSRFLVNYLAEFMARYPKLKVELHTISPGDLPDLNLDIFISRELQDFNSSSYIAKKLYDFQPGFFASPLYLENHDPILKPDDLLEHNCLLFGGPDFEQPHEFEDGTRLKLKGNFSSRNPEALIGAAVAGMGILLSGANNVRRELEKGLLVPVIPTLKKPMQTAYAYYPKLDYNHTKTHLFLAFIQEKSQFT
ncbi:LysR family transcriptional regulator [Thaumasiovibrio subtropicus]|uniref:LysR family transcriptional regulator n=1 Tax=Thaumasiovibrio subtropicus TaxID=1891207 RepID=UPI000B34FCAD|nr:LysR family transcriptional regulator [Thaumasiovibrio subtropicus]